VELQQLFNAAKQSPLESKDRVTKEVTTRMPEPRVTTAITSRSKMHVTARLILTFLVAATIPALVIGQTPVTTRLIMSSKSNLDTASVSEGFAKYCPNVVITENESKADYVLEAVSKTTYSDGDSSSQWHFTLLSKDGNILMTTHPEMHFTHKYKHHFELVCKYINDEQTAHK
jgi:hypothetical protein